ncbi:mRNA decay protein [Exophiala sp. CCFEE 6169]|uniref:mRNA decay protein n=1 Tax=Vermiconidia calcicola TaxID=1690605 RepID=A0AAV9QM59_9PEZI|nr:mRNA decay protein [Chaetothyriales sp. CCFEE 6169]KAK5545067.1 mRNA decay protein [Vermiconidia calcicola]
MDRKRKRELRDLNLRVWTGAKDVYDVAPSFDSSLKKNTAFIKRLRTGISSSGQDTFLLEIRTLSLQKYLSEIISATAEGLSRLKTASEIAAAVEIVSALHQRFGPEEYTKKLGWLLGKGLTPPDKAQVKSWTAEVREREEKERLQRHRILVRIVTEFWLCGILRGLDDVDRPDDVSTRGKEAPTQLGSKAAPLANGIKSDPHAEHEPFPLEVLKELLGHDPEHGNLSLAVLFVKNFAWDVLGLKSPSDEGRKTVDADGAVLETSRDASASTDANEDDAPIIPPPVRQRFVNVFERYLASVKSHIIRDQKTLNNQSRRNAEAYVKSGEIFEDRQANFEKQVKAQEKLVANAQILCDVLGQEMPDLAEKDGTETAASGTVGMIKTGDYLKGSAEGAGIWEDEEERRFYENLVDLKGRVPAILLEDSKKKSETDDRTDTTMSESSKPSEADDQSTAIANKSVGAQVDAILLRLPELQTKDMVDQVALDFCFLNSKASRNRLIKSLQEVPKGRTDLLPLYARLAATLGQYMPDIVQSLISHLDDEFRSLQRRKTKDFLGQVRLLNVRYLAELTKFGIVPEHVIFHCLKVSLDDFSRMNIEMAAHLLENCGRYLLRNPETSPRMASFLETLNRKKSAQHLGSQERMLIENALYYVDPPQRAAIQQKERTPMELFVRQMLYMDMTKRNYMKLLKTIRKLHWEEKEVVEMLEKIFSKPAKVKFSNIHLLAVLLQALFRYHQDFAIGVIDNVLEQVTLGLEQNDFKFNQRRVADVKYLGELYNYKMVDSTVIFDTLYRIVTFGHEGGTPQPDNYTPFDPPDDFFRIRLICTILDTCGICFDRGSSRKKLDFFLTFFQYYMTTKDPLPMEIDFLVQDTFSLVRPNWKLITDLGEAAKIFGEAVSANYKQSASEKAAEQAEELEDTGSDDDALGEGDGELEVPQSSDEEGEDGIEEDTGEEKQNDESDEEEQIVVMRQEEQLDPEAEADFDRAFEKMMSESLDSRKFERRSQFDVPLPIRKIQRQPQEPTEDEPKPPVESEPNTMAFSLMTKKGNRQQASSSHDLFHMKCNPPSLTFSQTKTIELPSDSSFAVSMKSQQAAEREEQQRIKNLVLNYDLREDDQHDGIPNDSPYGPIVQTPLQRNSYTKRPKSGLDHYNPPLSRAEKSGRFAPRSRRLNLSDVDWYGTKNAPARGPGSRSENRTASASPARKQSQNAKKPG